MHVPGTRDTVRNKTITSLERHSKEVMRPLLGSTLSTMSTSQRTPGFFKFERYVVESLEWESLRKQQAQRSRIHGEHIMFGKLSWIESMILKRCKR